MAGPYDFLASAPYGFDDWAGPVDPARPGRDLAGLSVILHDYGRTPQGGFTRDSFIPYHLVVTPEGRLIQRYRPDQVAPHAYHSNPQTIGIAYGAPVGAEPTERARETMQWLARNLPPGTRYETHGEAYERTRGTPQQASAAGRGQDEASRWVGIFRSGDDPAVAPAVAAPAAPRALLPLTAYAGLTPPPAPPAVPPPSLAPPRMTAVTPPTPPPPTPAPLAPPSTPPTPPVAAASTAPTAAPTPFGLGAGFGRALLSLAGSGGGQGRDGSPDPGQQALGQQQQALSQVLARLVRGHAPGVAGYRDGGAVTAALAIAARNTNTDPTEKQKEAGNYAKGRVRFAGLDIRIENPKGSERRGVDKDGKPWRCRLPAHYGYFSRTEGKDGDHVDCYIGDKPDNETVWVIDQVDAETGRFDEHKAMVGFPTRQAALSAYERAFSDGKGKDRIGGVTEMHVEKLKAWLRDGDTKKPARSQRGFADGGLVERLLGGMTMPLFGGGKKNVSRNISTLIDEGRPHDQAVAIALDVARRGTKRNGGRTGYAGGGDPPLSDGPVPPVFDDPLGAAPRFSDIFSDPYRHGSIDYTEMGRHSPSGVRPPLDTPVTDYVLGAGVDAPRLRTGERVMRDIGRGVVMGGPEMVEGGLGNLEGALGEGSVSRGVGALGQIALGAVSPVLPWLRPFRTAMSARPLPTVMGTGAAYTGVPVLAEHGLGSSAQAQEPDDGLTPQLRARQAELRRQLQRRNLSEDVRETLQAELARIDGLSAAHLARKGDAATRLQEAEARARREEAAIEAARAREKSDLEAKRIREAADAEAWRNTPTARAYPWFGPAAATTGIGLGGLAAWLLSRRGMNTFNTRMADYGNRWQTALRDADRARTPAARQQFITEAQRLADDVSALGARGPRLQGAAPYGAAIGLTELGFAAPTILDYSSSAPGSPLREYTVKSLDPTTPEPYGRYIFGGLLGAAAGKAGTTLGKLGYREPPDFRARTDALAERYPQRLRSETEPLPLHTQPPPSASRTLPPPAPEAGSAAPTAPPVLSQLESAPARPTGPRRLQDMIDPNESPPAPTGRASPPPDPSSSPAIPAVVVRSTDSRGRRFHYDPGSGRRTSPPPKPEPDNKPQPRRQSRGSRPKPEKPEDGRRFGGHVGPDSALALAQRYAASGGSAGGPGETQRYHPDDVMAMRQFLGTPGLVQTEAGDFYSSPDRDPDRIPEPAPQQSGLLGWWRARRGARASGGVVTGPVIGTTGGRADAKPVDVEGGSYVVPADIVAACGEGNTLAGHKVLEGVFGPSLPSPRAAGGAVPILISDGEHVLTPQQVAKVGRGDHAKGCRVLDSWVKDTRSRNIKHLKGLPGPAKG